MIFLIELAEMCVCFDHKRHNLTFHCRSGRMNAAICVCHFCEVHGPRVVVCTRATGGTVSSEGVGASASVPPSCDGCSPGPTERRRRLSSGRLTTSSDDDALLAHAALRSLSCEVITTFFCAFQF